METFAVVCFLYYQRFVWLEARLPSMVISNEPSLIKVTKSVEKFDTLGKLVLFVLCCFVINKTD